MGHKRVEMTGDMVVFTDGTVIRYLDDGRNQVILPDGGVIPDATEEQLDDIRSGLTGIACWPFLEIEDSPPAG